MSAHPICPVPQQAGRQRSSDLQPSNRTKLEPKIAHKRISSSSSPSRPPVGIQASAVSHEVHPDLSDVDGLDPLLEGHFLRGLYRFFRG